MTDSAFPQSVTRGLRSDQCAGLMLIALATYVGWMNRVYPLGTLQEPGPGYVPLILAIFLGVMGLLVVIGGRHSASLASIDWRERWRAIAILVACAFAAYGLERLGYRITMAALLVFFLGALERKHPAIVLTVALSFAFVTYYLFATLLRVPLPVSRWGV
jgi:putative tricarboxylic transport membrane protein